MPKKTTLNNMQKHELCVYACDNKKTQFQYVDWIKNKWNLSINESTVSRILKTSKERLENKIINSNTKRHKTVTYPKLDLALKEFMLIYQHQTILSDALLVEKAKALADGLGISQEALNFSLGWLYKFKNQNSIRLCLFQGESVSANEVAISNIMPDEVNINTIRNCWYHTKILSEDTNSYLQSSLEEHRQATDSVLNDIADALDALDFFDPMQVDEFLAIPEENIIYEVLSDD
ncbi:2386_t:CDS:2 [Dentiscutata heterogama]|uniref:2386_t:CDS:1 n=1 Tax=Dentiscutata heterogama TaxID=1316150 RepID=A0ACA9JXN3_9GLOM|nr:2386_t:CDS:2 [Dentiscutata heterogama]